jgi:hypothetical protein
MFAIGPEPGASRAAGLRWFPNNRPARPMTLGNMRHLQGASCRPDFKNF